MMILTSSLLVIVMSATACGQSSQKQTEPNDTIPVRNEPDATNAMVELTPEFIAAIQKYDQLGVFSEGLAAVCKNNKWGYINTKGEEVIPCQFSCASLFKDGLAAAGGGYINTKGEIVISEVPEGFSGYFSEGLACIASFKYKDYPEQCEQCFNTMIYTVDFIIIDKEGKEIFQVKTGNHSFMLGEGGMPVFDDVEENIPCFENGEISIPFENKNVVYDRKGIKVREEAYKYRVEEDISSKYNIPDYGMYECWGGDNGVVLIALYELKGEIYEGYNEGCGTEFESSDMVTHYGYVDKNGKDTFTPELKARCKKLYDKAVKEIGTEESW